jgi:hypothetical protein
MKKLALILALALATTPAFARAGEVAAIGVEFTPDAAPVFMAIVTSIEVAAMATVTTDITATTDIMATMATMATMVTTVVIPEPLLA